MKHLITLCATNGEPVEISISELAPRTETLAQQADVFATHADIVEAVLYESMPGGLYDRLLGAMLKRKASHFIVSHR
jgi:hypothetical protein